MGQGKFSTLCAVELLYQLEVTCFVSYQFYLEDPERNATGTTPEQRKLIIGGEASTWGDCISAESFDVMTWPAASSVAEVDSV